MQTSFFLSGLGALLGVLALGGCAAETGSADDVAPLSNGLYVGEVDGSDALVALLVSPVEVVFYTCGGPRTLGSDTHWFRAERPGDGEAALDPTLLGSTDEIGLHHWPARERGLIEVALDLPDREPLLTHLRPSAYATDGLYYEGGPCGIGAIVAGDRRQGAECFVLDDEAIPIPRFFEVTPVRFRDGAMEGVVHRSPEDPGQLVTVPRVLPREVL